VLFALETLALQGTPLGVPDLHRGAQAAVEAADHGTALQVILDQLEAREQAAAADGNAQEGREAHERIGMNGLQVALLVALRQGHDAAVRVLLEHGVSLLGAGRCAIDMLVATVNGGGSTASMLRRMLPLVVAELHRVQASELEP